MWCLAAGYATAGYDTAANAKESLIFSAALVMAVRTAVWAFMHVLQKRFKYVALQRQLMLGKNAAANGLSAAPTPHIELGPLMRGAWIVSNLSSRCYVMMLFVWAWWLCGHDAVTLGLIPLV